MAESETYDSAWWSMKIATGWHVRTDKECATFQQSPCIGAFQISSARKDGPISSGDLKAFANEQMPHGTQLVEVSYGDFLGFTACYQREEMLWREWWLGFGPLMIYATYNVPKKALKEALSEQRDLERMLATLKSRNVAAL